MRLLFLTDTHLRATNPVNRLDNLPEALEAKLTEIVELARVHQVRAVIHGGDLFDRATPGLGGIAGLLRPLRRLDAPLYIVPGNHDIFGRNIETLPRTLLGFMGEMDIFRILGSEPVFLEEAGLRVRLTGAPYRYDMDDGDGDSYVVQKEDCDVAIHVVHGMLVDKPLPGGVPCTLVDQIKECTQADYTLAGHYHVGWPAVEYQGKWFINPGGLVRQSNHPGEIARIPQVLLLELGHKSSHRLLPLKSAKPGYEVLDRSGVEEAAFLAEKRAQYLTGLRSGVNALHTDPQVILEGVLAGANLSPREAQQVRELAFRYLADAEEGGSGE